MATEMIRYDTEPLTIQIPHVMVVPIADWILPSQGFRGTEYVLPTKKLGFAIHHPGGAQLSYVNDVRLAAQRMHADYLSSRKYSLGYNFLIDRPGRLGIVRGRYRSAANGTVTGNNSYLAIQFLVDPDDKVTHDQILTAERLIAFGREHWGYGNAIVPHSFIKATACPGPLAPLVADGTFEPKPSTWPENQIVLPPPKPPVVQPPVVQPPQPPAEGADVDGYEVIQFQYEDQTSAWFVKHGLELAGLWAISDGGVVYNIPEEWMKATKQERPTVYPSMMARQFSCKRGHIPPDVYGYLKFAQLGIAVTD